MASPRPVIEAVIVVTRVHRNVGDLWARGIRREQLTDNLAGVEDVDLRQRDHHEHRAEHDNPPYAAEGGPQDLLHLTVIEDDGQYQDRGEHRHH